MASNRLDRVAAILDRLTRSNQDVDRWYPGEPTRRQPIHTVYGGAHLFKAGTARKLGELALASLDRVAPEPGAFAAALELPGDRDQHALLDARTRHKLATEPIEDYRIDFEDGFGPRPEAEEDEHATRAAGELARAWIDGTAPPVVGIRVKPLSEASKARSARTLQRFLGELVHQAGGLRSRFLVTLPKVTTVAQVEAMAELLGVVEASFGLPDRALELELMVEATQVLVDRDGRCPLPLAIHAAGGRCAAVHLGAYDLTAAAGVTAPDQALDHPLCDLARQLMIAACSGTEVRVVDGATNVLPIGDPATVRAAWRLHARNVRGALREGIFQGWDLHPAQLPARYAVTYAHFLDALEPMTARLRNFVDQAAHATRVGATFDDAATGRGLVGFFARGHACGALSDGELARTGLTVAEVRSADLTRFTSAATTPSS